MAKTVIALRGPANTGKSEIIKEVMGLTKLQRKNSKDATLILMMDKVRVGFESQGDPNSGLGDSLELLQEMECKVIVCATRTEGQTVNAVKALEPDYKVRWIEQVRAKGSNYKTSNRKMAIQISREIEQAIGR